MTDVADLIAARSQSISRPKNHLDEIKARGGSPRSSSLPAALKKRPPNPRMRTPLETSPSPSTKKRQFSLSSKQKPVSPTTSPSEPSENSELPSEELSLETIHFLQALFRGATVRNEVREKLNTNALDRMKAPTSKKLTHYKRARPPRGRRLPRNNKPQIKTLEKPTERPSIVTPTPDSTSESTPSQPQKSTNRRSATPGAFRVGGGVALGDILGVKLKKGGGSAPSTPVKNKSSSDAPKPFGGVMLRSTAKNSSKNTRNNPPAFPKGLTIPKRSVPVTTSNSSGSKIVVTKKKTPPPSPTQRKKPVVNKIAAPNKMSAPKKSPPGEPKTNPFRAFANASAPPPATPPKRVKSSQFPPTAPPKRPPSHPSSDSGDAPRPPVPSHSRNMSQSLPTPIAKDSGFASKLAGFNPMMMLTKPKFLVEKERRASDAGVPPPTTGGPPNSGGGEGTGMNRPPPATPNNTENTGTPMKLPSPTATPEDKAVSPTTTPPIESPQKTPDSDGKKGRTRRKKGRGKGKKKCIVM